MDPTVKPGDDFFRYVNGKWLAATQIPPDRTGYGSGAILTELSEVRVRGIVDKWAADKKLKAGSDEAKVAALYRTFLDDARRRMVSSSRVKVIFVTILREYYHMTTIKLAGSGTEHRMTAS